jgi:L-type amino acid transporter 5
VIKEVGSIGLSLIIWVVCGIISIFGAKTYAELGCMIPKAGGDYEYIMAAFGSVYGFLFVWSQLVIIIPTANAVAALTFADYILQPVFSTCEVPSTARTLIAATAVCKNAAFILIILILELFEKNKRNKTFSCSKVILTILNCVSTKWVNRVQNIFSLGKLIALLIIIIFGIYCLINGE